MRFRKNLKKTLTPRAMSLNLFFIFICLARMPQLKQGPRSLRNSWIPKIRIARDSDFCCWIQRWKHGTSVHLIQLLLEQDPETLAISQKLGKKLSIGIRRL